MSAENGGASLPRVLANTGDLSAHDGGASGAVWKLTMGERDLDSNLIALRPHGTIDRHTGPDLDVLVHVVAGGGVLVLDGGTVELAPGDLVWLPKRTTRGFTAGADGLRYLTVHQRKPGLGLTQRP